DADAGVRRRPDPDGAGGAALDARSRRGRRRAGLGRVWGPRRFVAGGPAPRLGGRAPGGRGVAGGDCARPRRRRRSEPRASHGGRGGSVAVACAAAQGLGDLVARRPTRGTRGGDRRGGPGPRRDAEGRGRAGDRRGHRGRGAIRTAHGAGGRGARPAREGPLQQNDRARATHQRAHRQIPHLLPLRQARREQPRRSRQPGRPARTHLVV
ncbi:MAG: hypothetical protein AVDCRST_MAG02-66, partial [uncultured Rubrobacteraceae bacterium]